jgi:hypothetical protein
MDEDPDAHAPDPASHTPSVREEPAGRPRRVASRLVTAVGERGGGRTGAPHPSSSTAAAPNPTVGLAAPAPHRTATLGGGEAVGRIWPQRAMEEDAPSPCSSPNAPWRRRPHPPRAHLRRWGTGTGEAAAVARRGEAGRGGARRRRWGGLGG